MPTLTFCCGAECGIVGANSTPTVARRHWTTAGTTAPTINTSLSRPGGARCYSFSPANTTSYLSQTITGSPTTCVGRFAVRFETLPTGNAHLFSFNTGGSWCFVAFRASDNTLGVTTSTTLATFTAGPVIEAGKWYVVDVKANVSANPWLIDFRVNGTAGSQHSIAIAAGTFTTFRVGGEVVNTDKTHTAYIDDIAVSSTSGDYPLGDGCVCPLSPNVDGTHNFSASTDFEYNDTTGISPSATDVYTYIDDLPDNITDFISCNAASNTEYIEFGFANLPTTIGAINGMEIVSAHHASGSAANKQTLRMNDGGSLADLWADADLSATSLHTVSAHSATAPSSGAAWTKAKVDALLMRWNSSYGTVDENPVPYLDAVMLEVDLVRVYSATSAVTVGAATLSGVADVTNPTYSATSAVTVGAATLAGAATHTPPTFTGTSAVTVGAATLSGTATHVTPTYTGTSAVTVGAATLAGTATFVGNNFTATAALTVGAATLLGTYHLQQSDTSTGGDGGTAQCSGAAIAPEKRFRIIAQYGAVGSTPAQVTLDASPDEAAIFFETVAGQPGLVTWEAGNYVVRLNITTAATGDVKWVDTYLCRVNSANVNQGTVGSLTGQTTDIGSTGVKTHTVSGSEQTANTGDRLYVVLVFSNAETSAVSFSFTPDQVIDTPWTSRARGTFVAPVYSATAAVTVGAATLAGTATFATATFTATSAVTVGAATLAGTATHTTPTYTGTSAVTVGAATLAGTATHTTPVYSATSAVTVGPATLAGTATFVAPVYSATAAVTVGAATLAGTATHVTPTYTGTASLTAGAATLAGTATVVNPTYSATAAVTVGAATLAGTAIFATAVYSGTSAVTVGAATLSGSATFVVPTYTGTSSLTVGAATLAAAGTVVNPRIGTAALVVGAATLSGSATHVTPTYTGTATLTVGAATLAATATFFDPTAVVYTATGSLTTGAATMVAYGTPTAFDTTNDDSRTYVFPRRPRRFVFEGRPRRFVFPERTRSIEGQ